MACSTEVGSELIPVRISDPPDPGQDDASLEENNTEQEPIVLEVEGQSLAPVDGGFAAWRLICAAFMFEALLWGKIWRYEHALFRL